MCRRLQAPGVCVGVWDGDGLCHVVPPETKTLTPPPPLPPLGARVQAWYTNAYQMQTMWCGVGQSTGLRSMSACCGSGQGGGDWIRDYGTGNCNIYGAPTFLTNLASPPDKADGWKMLGMDAPATSGGNWMRMYLMSSANGGALGFNGRQGQYCIFGNNFPTGKMLVAQGRILKTSYPCTGVRILNSAGQPTATGKPCCGVTDDVWTQRDNYIEKVVDTSDCNFAPNPVYITSLKAGSQDTDLSSYVGAASTVITGDGSGGFSVRIGRDPAPTVQDASSQGVKLQWCGFGPEGPPKLVQAGGAAAAAPLKAVVPSPPPPASAMVVDGEGKSLLNIYCAKWRDKRTALSADDQKRTLAFCMAQDCQQSLGNEDRVCRFLDSLGLCYNYKVAQEWCSKNLASTYCQDGGADWAPAPYGSAPSLDKTAWMPKQNAVVAGSVPGAGTKYSCACIKHCGCTPDTSAKHEHACRCLNGNNQEFVGDPVELAHIKTKTRDGNKAGKCFCSCGGQAGA